jgi:hypothetical protein
MQASENIDGSVDQPILGGFLRFGEGTLLRMAVKACRLSRPRRDQGLQRDRPHPYTIRQAQSSIKNST